MHQNDKKSLLQWIENINLPGFLKEEVTLFISGQPSYKCLRLKAVHALFEKYLEKLDQTYTKDLHKILSQKKEKQIRIPQSFSLNTMQEISIDYILSSQAQEKLKLTTDQILNLLDVENELINLMNCYKGMFLLESTTFIHGSETRLLTKTKQKKKH